MNSLRAATIALSLFLSLICRSQVSGSPPMSALAGETPQAQSQTGATPAADFQTQANLVMVDVVVSHKGSPVRGLGQEKFRVSDNGKPRQLTVFESHEPGDAPKVPPQPALGPNTYSNLPELSGPSASNVLLLDALNTPVSDQMNVRQKMLLVLKTLPHGAPIAVFTLASRLRIVQGFTTDPSAIARSITGNGIVSSSWLMDLSPDSQALDAANGLASGEASPDVVSSLQQFQADTASFETDLRVRTTLDAMKQMARYLGTMPGRKNLIWISGSFPLHINPDPALDNPFEAMRNYSEDVREADMLLSTARVAVYPIDGRGQLTPPSANAANSFTTTAPSMRSAGGRGRRRGGGLPANSSGIGPNLSPAAQADRIFQQQTAEEHFSMQQIAEETGGTAYFNTNAVGDAVAEAIANGSTYYSIGYVPDVKKDDRSYHRLKISVDGGYQVSYRRGYFAGDAATGRKRPEAEAKLLGEALEPGMPPVSDLVFKAHVVPADNSAEVPIKPSADPAGAMANNLTSPLCRYVIDFDVATGRLVLTVTADGNHHARLEFGVVAYDSRGRRLNYADKSLDFRLPPNLFERVMHDGVPFRQEIDLPPGQAFLRIMVRDLNSARLGVFEVPVRVNRK